MFDIWPWGRSPCNGEWLLDVTRGYRGGSGEAPRRCVVDGPEARVATEIAWKYNEICEKGQRLLKKPSVYKMADGN